MKRLLNRNTYLNGFLLAIGSELLCALLLWAVLAVSGLGVEANLRWMAAAFVPPLLLLRYYARQKEYPLAFKAVIVTFFVTFVAFMWVMLKYRYVTFN